VYLAANDDSYFTGGNIGIGTTSPSSPLHILTATTVPLVQLELTGNPGAGVIFNISTSGSIGSGTDVFRYNGDGATEVFVLRGDGSVGIGTSSPGAKLEIVGSISNEFITIQTNSSTRTHLLLETVRNGYYQIFDSSDTVVVQIASSLDTYFNGGDVGIGTTDPSTPLSAGFSSDGLTIGDGTDTEGIVLYSGTTTTLSALRFGDAGGGNYDQGGLIYNHNEDSMAITTSRGTRFKINSSGGIDFDTTGIPGHSAGCTVKMDATGGLFC